MRELLKRRTLENPGLKKKSIEQYSIAVNLFAKYLGREPHVEDLETEKIAGFVTWLVANGRSARTANGKRATLLMLARFASELGWLPKLPRVKKLTEPRRTPRGFTSEEMTAILKACEFAPSMPMILNGAKKVRTWTPTEWQILLRAIWETAARPTSLLGVTFGDIQRGMMVVRAELTKTMTDHCRPISPTLHALIQQRKDERRAGECDLVLDWPGHHRQLWYALRRYILNPAGIDKHVSLYGARKGAISYIAKKRGVQEAARFAGHRNPKVTIDSYIDPRIADDDYNAIECLPQI